MPGQAPPLVSCIMPTAGRRQFVPRALAYFLRQDYEPRELVVVDDGDDPIDDLLPDDGRVRYLRLETRLTLGAKRNAACEAARGELIMNWDDDDWMAPWRIRYQVAALLAQAADVCGLRQMLFYDPAADVPWLYTCPPGGRGWLAGGSLLYRRDLWRRAPYHNIQVGEDARFVWSRQVRHPVALPDWSFYVALIHAGNTSPKVCGPPCWARWSGDVRQIMGDDLDHYRPGAAPGQPAPTPSLRGAQRRSNRQAGAEIASAPADRRLAMTVEEEGDAAPADRRLAVTGSGDLQVGPGRDGSGKGGDGPAPGGERQPEPGPDGRRGLFQEEGEASMKLNLGCCDAPLADYVNVDLAGGLGIEQVDLRQPWPWPASSVDWARAWDIIEHLPDKILTMNELWRVLKPGGRVEIAVPTTDGSGAFQDPTHVSFWNRRSFLYYEAGNPYRERFAGYYGIEAKFRTIQDRIEQTVDGPRLTIVLEAVKP